MKYLNYFQESLFSSLQSPRLISSFSDDKGIMHETEITPRYRDIHFLINQKSLEHLDPSQLSKFLAPLNSGNDSADSNFNIPDEDLFALCSSRYIQQPSDVESYARFLTERADAIKSRYEKNESQKKAWSDFVKSLKSSDPIHTESTSTDSNS